MKGEVSVNHESVKELVELLLRDDLHGADWARQNALIDELLVAGAFELFGRMAFRALMARQVALLQARRAMAVAKLGGIDARGWSA
jgi:hypothetical protein